MSTVYTAGHVLTTEGPGGELRARPGAALLVDEGRIVAVGDATALVPRAERSEVVDFGPGRFIVPGLVDTHVHLALDAGNDPRRSLETATRDDRLALMLVNARKLLSAGVTTARDLGAPDLLDQAVKAAIGTGEAHGPRLLTVTAPLTVPGGHCWFFGGECEGTEGVRRRVRQAHRDGADAIKVMATGGHLTPGTEPSLPQFTAQELAAAVDEAHGRGLRVTAHAHGEVGILRAIHAGVDSVEHFSFVQPDGRRRPNPGIERAAAESGVFVCPTVSLAWAHAVDCDHFAPGQRMRELLDRGIRVVAGTDAGIDDAPHEEYISSLEGMGALGMSNDEVLTAATSLAAESLGLEAEIGTLEVGKSADFLVVGGNPRRHLGHLRNPYVVVVAGRRYTPEFPSAWPWNRVAPGLPYRSSQHRRPPQQRGPNMDQAVTSHRPPAGGRRVSTTPEGRS